MVQYFMHPFINLPNQEKSIYICSYPLLCVINFTFWFYSEINHFMDCARNWFVSPWLFAIVIKMLKSWIKQLSKGKFIKAHTERKERKKGTCSKKVSQKERCSFFRILRNLDIKIWWCNSILELAAGYTHRHTHTYIHTFMCVW